MQIHSAKFPPVNGSKPINGRGIKRRKLTPDKKIKLAADIATGVRPFVPSVAQTCTFVGVPQRAVAVELKARVAAKNSGVHHQERHGNGGPTDELTREEARKLAHVVFGALQKLNDLPSDVWGDGEAECIRHETKLALKWARLLNSSIYFWRPDLDAGEFPSEPAGMQASTVPTAQAAE
jgi:hypothetical protein